MNVKFSHTIFNTESTERIPLIINGVNVGDYSFGLYSRWMIERLNRGERTIPDVAIYVCWLLKEKHGVDVKSANGLQEALTLCDRNIGYWFEKVMKADL